MMAQAEKIVSINRNPFARSETVRRIVYTVRDTCDWCGDNRGGRLFEYGTAHDGGRTEWHTGRFCSKYCHNAYHG